jgi:hypothetical protein
LEGKADSVIGLAWPKADGCPKEGWPKTEGCPEAEAWVKVA